MNSCSGAKRYSDTNNEYCPFDRGKDLTTEIRIECEWCYGSRVTEEAGPCELCGARGFYEVHPCVACKAYDRGVQV